MGGERSMYWEEKRRTPGFGAETWGKENTR